MNQSEIEANTCNRRQARENACEQGTIGFGFAADLLRKWRVFCWPITERSKAKPKQTWNYFRHSIEIRSKQKQDLLMSQSQQVQDSIRRSAQCEHDRYSIFKGLLKIEETSVTKLIGPSDLTTSTRLSASTTFQI